jgi:RHS repeat-associated protein
VVTVNSVASNGVSFTVAPYVYAHRRPITIDHTKVPNTDQANFPVLISGVYSFLATTGNGGQVQNANGYDIIFTSDFAGTTKLDHEIDSYDPLTGTINMWVRLPALSHTCDTVIYVVYGNAAVATSQENRTGVWDPNYQGVWHLTMIPGQYGSVLVNDSTANLYDGVVEPGGAGYHVNATGGMIAEAVEGDNGAIEFFETTSSLQITGALTIEAWIKAIPGTIVYSGTTAALVNYVTCPSSGGTGFCGGYELLFDTKSNRPYIQLRNSSDGSLADAYGSTLPDGLWYHVVGTYDGTTLTTYVNGVAGTPSTASGMLVNTNLAQLLFFVSESYERLNQFNGGLDELRISSTSRSADWIAAEFANESSPAAFATVGSENTIGVDVCPSASALSGGQTQQFTAIVTNTGNQAVTWSSVPASAGSVGPTSGLYTAASTPVGQHTVTITATSEADPTKTGPAIIDQYGTGTFILSPLSVSLAAGQTQQFTAVVANAPGTAVTWSLGAGNVGSISASGLYTAPSGVLYARQTVIVTAAVPGSTASATVIVLPTATVSVTPATATLGASESQQFTANVAGWWNTGLNWKVLGVGSITQDGIYTAPSSIAASTSVTIIASSAAIPTAIGTAIITLSPAASSITVAVAPSQVSLTNAQSQQFTASVAGTYNIGVNWTLNPNVGSISSSGMYTAPANVASPQTITLQAASAASPTSFSIATILIAPAPTNNYSYRRAIVIDHTEVPNTDQVNFPVLITGSYAYLATVANRGHVDNPNGYDIVFSSDCAGLQQLDHEIASYNAATGQVSLWVLLPLVSHNVDTVFYMSYGNSAISTSQENRATVDAARNPSTTHSADWAATASNNQNSPATFYTIYPENTNSVDAPSVTLSAGQTQQFLPLFTVTAAATTANPLVLLGGSTTPSPAESVATNGNYAYVCDDNEVSIIDVSNPANPVFRGAALAADMSNTGIARCAVQNRSTGPVLLAFVDAAGTFYGDNPTLVAFGLQNPSAPELIAETNIPEQYFEQPVFSADGNTAYVPISWLTTVRNFWSDQGGDVLAIDVTDLAAPTVLDTMETGNNSNLDGGNAMFGAAMANSITLLEGGSTSTGAADNGTGELVVTDVTNPASISIITTLPVPNTVQIFDPVLQGNLAIALGDTGGWSAFGGDPGPITLTYLGNLTLTTFDITNPRSPSILANIVLPYTKFYAGPAVQIGPNLSLFAGAIDSSGNNLLLLIDTTNPLVPVVTPYTVPAGVTGMTVVGNLLHVTAGAAGYAIYQIPGVTNSQYHLTGNCNGPFKWDLGLGAQGTLSASGLYSAPASVASGQPAAVTVTSQVDSTQTATAAVSLSSGTLAVSLSPSTPGPYVVGGSATFIATVTSGSVPFPGVTVTLAITGANSASIIAVTGSNGTATLSYTGTLRGADSLQASANSYTSNVLSALWVSPSTAFTTTPVQGNFFAASSCKSGCEAFTTAFGSVPAFSQIFPDLMFNATNPSPSPRSFADIILGRTGAPTGSILAQEPTTVTQGNTLTPGGSNMVGFSAVFTGNFVVAQAGNYTINVFSQDGFIFGVGNGASRVSVNTPAGGLTAFDSYPVMGANNGPSTGAAIPIVVAFPVPGSYPFEFDYKSGTGGPLALTVTVAQGSGAASGVGPLESLVLTSITAAPVAGQSASFTVKATDETGAPIKALPFAVNVAGIAPQTLHGTTDTAGLATVSYTETAAMTDLLQASALVNGLQLVTAQTTVVWGASPQASQAPLISVAGDRLLYLPASGSYIATVTDPAAPAGGDITVNWSQTGGPTAVTFSTPQQLATSVTFTGPGTYMLQVTATDKLGSRTQLVGPIVVNPHVPLSVPSGWLASPNDHTQVTGVVPITVISTETLASCALSYYPTANPNAITVLDTTASACGTQLLGTQPLGTLAMFDTTLLANGAYYVYLQATDSNGKSMASGVDILVGGDYKPGRVTSTVTDLVVPAPGLPIRISRTYDSLVRSTSGDFGYGWNLGVNVQLDVSADHDVTLTINGQRRTFYFTPYQPGFQLGNTTFPNLMGVYYSAYTPEPGMFGSLSVWSNGSSVIASNTGCFFDWLAGNGTSFGCYGGGGTYSPGGYVYTDPYGRVYTISSTGGLQSIQDLGGNTITITPGGISSTNGLSVPFVRDDENRITQITDSVGNHYNYAYDSSGNLQTVTYPSMTPGVTLQGVYTYDPTHLYTGGTDTRNNPLPTTQYDAFGRLQSVTLVADSQTSYTTGYKYDTADPVTVPYADGTSGTGFATTITYPADATGYVGTATMVYDSYGKLLSSTDPNGNKTTNEYDASHNLIAITDPLGHTTTYTYDSSGNRISKTYPRTATSKNTTSQTTYNAYREPVSIKDENGNTRYINYDANFWPALETDSIGPRASCTFNANGTLAAKVKGYDLSATSGVATTFTYDQYGNPATRTDPAGTDTATRVTTYQYNTLGQKTSMTTAAGGTTGYQYDPFGNLTQTNAPLGRTTSAQFDGNDNRISSTDADGNTTTYLYDNLNRLKQVTYPVASPNTVTHTYDFRNNVIDSTDQAGHVTHHQYDYAGRLQSVTALYGTPNAQVTASYTYYADGRTHTVADARGNTTTYSYDAAGRLTEVSYPPLSPTTPAATTHYGYDSVGNQVSVTDPNGYVTQKKYDARNRLTTVIYPDETKKQYAYDGPGNLASVTDQTDKSVQYTADADNELQSVIQPFSPYSAPQNTTAFAYDHDGNLTDITDANGNTTHRVFDALNRLTSTTLPDNTLVATKTYDYVGNLHTHTDFNGHTTTYGYDTLNRLISKTPAATEPTVGFTFTSTGKRYTMTDGSGTTQFAYDNFDRLSSKVTPEGTLNYTYDPAGNLATMSSADGNVSVSYTWDPLNRLSTVVDNRLSAGSSTTTYTYDPAGNLSNVTYPNGAQSNYGYDHLNRLNTLNGYTYQLDSAGHRQSVTEPNGRAVSWTYDGIYRLTNETITGDPGPTPKDGSVGYGLDPVGNRSSENSSIPGIPTVASLLYDADDRMVPAETYDNNGNTLSTGGKSFGYDSGNHLTSMTGVATLVYDGDGHRVAKTAAGKTTTYLIDDLNPTGYAQVVEEIVNGVPQRTYTYGTQRISQNQVVSGTWTASFYGYDGFGNVRQLMDRTGAVTDSYEYDAWGNTINSAGTTANNYFYRGEQYDSDLGLYYLRARYFNPLTGRFLRRDSQEGSTRTPASLHKYMYANGDPVNGLDPTGCQDLVEYTELLQFAAQATVAVTAAILLVKLMESLPPAGGGSGGGDGSGGSGGSGGGSGAGEGVGAGTGTPPLPPVPHGCNGGVCRNSGGTPVDSWQQAEEWLNDQFGGRQQVRFDVEGETRIVDNLTPDNIAQEAKFGEQSLSAVMEQIHMDLDLLAETQIDGIQWWFFTSPEGGTASEELLEYLYDQNIRVFVDGVPWEPGPPFGQ